VFPIFKVILNDAEGVYPDVSISKTFAHSDSVSKRGGEVAVCNTDSAVLLEIRAESSRRLNAGVSPTMAECHESTTFSTCEHKPRRVRVNIQDACREGLIAIQLAALAGVRCLAFTQPSLYEIEAFSRAEL
jgi:hypothetical protein